MPPFSSTGGDLIDQLREWFDRIREKVAARTRGDGARPPRRPGRRSTTLRSQAVPLGSAQARAASVRRAGERRTGTLGPADRAERSTYTLVFAAVLVALVVGLFFTLSWALGVGGPFGSSPPAATASPSPAVSQLPPPKTVGEVVPSPSPSPSPEASPPPPATTGRVHVVQAGDTLNRISQQYGVTVDGIMQANGFTDRNRILRIGERLVIPDSPPASPAPVPR